MVERTLLTKESHGSLASSQRSHERCCHSPQHSLNHVLPATQPATGHLAPQRQQQSLALLCPWCLSGLLLWKDEALSEVMLMTLVSSAFPLPSPQGHAGHGGEVDGRDALFQVRHNHAVAAACGLKRVTESNDVTFTPRIAFSKCCGSFHSPAPPLPPSQASIVIAY